MKNFIERVKELKNNFWNAYIVTGGTNVFVAVEKKNMNKVADEAKNFNAKPVFLKVAGPPEVISRNF